MTQKPLARDVLWDTAASQHGFVTARQARDLGISDMAIRMLVHRGTMQAATYGVYRFPHYPVSQYDPYMLAVLWTRVDKACLSHETALDAYAISDINPNVIHITVGKTHRLRRTGGQDYVIHHENLAQGQVGWWQEVPTVTPATAVAQCITYGTPTYLLRQALTRGHTQGYLTTRERDQLTQALEERHARHPR
jgi:predicted transcriptional regulator of viral defense system